MNKVQAINILKSSGFDDMQIYHISTALSAGTANQYAAEQLDDVLQIMYDDLFHMHEEMMEMEYATEACSTYWEDDVWALFKKHTALLKQQIRNAELIIKYAMEDDEE